MNITKNASLKTLNSFGVDVKANYLIDYESVEELKEILQLDLTKNQPILPIGCGSNLLFLSDFKGIVIYSKIMSINILKETENEIFIESGSGVVWDDFVRYAVENNWGGIENLSLIPGVVGATAIQNIGAYGAEVKDVIEKVNTIEIESLKEKNFSNEACDYHYRDSIFKHKLKGKYIISSVVYRLKKNPHYNIQYQLVKEEVEKYGDINLLNIRKAIISIRNSKLPDPKMHGNAGSYFMNPIISRETFDILQQKFPQIPFYKDGDDLVKLPAAWLIEQCGWKGRQIGNVAVHENQALVIINKGNASGMEIASFARLIQESVYQQFEIQLHPEVIYI